jgi:hypothetical protein
MKSHGLLAAIKSVRGGLGEIKRLWLGDRFWAPYMRGAEYYGLEEMPIIARLPAEQDGSGHFGLG